MRKPVVALILLGCIGLAAFTSHKLYKMARITGRLGDREIAQHVVSNKSIEPGRRADTCWLWFDNDRIQSDCDYWQKVERGDRIEVVTIDGEQFLKDGEIYASDGNFMFDFVLLAGEIIGAIACFVLLIRRAK